MEVNIKVKGLKKAQDALKSLEKDLEQPFREVILGDVDFNVIQYCDKAEQDRLTYIFDKTKNNLNQFQKQLHL